MTNEFDIIEHPLVAKWFAEFAKTEPLGFSFLTRGNIEYFESIWGKSTGQAQGFLYWKREYLGIIIYVYSDENSSFYKVQYLGTKDLFVNDQKMGSYLLEFLNKFVKEIAA